MEKLTTPAQPGPESTTSAASSDGPDPDPVPTSAHDEMDESERAAEDARERIAARAYDRYIQRGGGHGGHLDDWLEAEREIAGRSDRPNDE